MGFAYANGTSQRQPLDSIVTPRDESAYLKVQRFEAISEVVSSATKITCLDKKDHHPFPFSMFFWGVPCWISKKDVCLEDSVFRIFLFYHQKLGGKWSNLTSNMFEKRVGKQHQRSMRIKSKCLKSSTLLDSCTPRIFVLLPEGKNPWKWPDNLG